MSAWLKTNISHTSEGSATTRKEFLPVWFKSNIPHLRAQPPVGVSYWLAQMMQATVCLLEARIFQPANHMILPFHFHLTSLYSHFPFLPTSAGTLDCRNFRLFLCFPHFYAVDLCGFDLVVQFFDICFSDVFHIYKNTCQECMGFFSYLSRHSELFKRFPFVRLRSPQSSTSSRAGVMSST